MKTAVKTDLKQDEGDDLLGICPHCGSAEVIEFHNGDKESFLQPPKYPTNRRRCRECQNIWAGLYRRVFKDKPYVC